MAANVFQEANGTNSSARVIFVIGMAWAMAFTTAGAFALAWSPGSIVAVFGALSGVFVGLKLGQKAQEAK